MQHKTNYRYQYKFLCKKINYEKREIEHVISTTTKTDYCH